MKKTTALLLMAVVILLSACNSQSNKEASKASNPAEGEKRTFIIAQLGPQEHIWTYTMKFLKDDLENRTNGRLSMELFPGAVLGNEPDMIQQMQSGSLDMAIITTAEISNHSPSFKAWMLPFAIKDMQHAYDMGMTDEGKAMLDTLNDIGLHNFGYMNMETRGILMRDELVEDYKQIAGKKVRVTPSPMIIDWWQTLGAIPTPIALPELFSSFQTGVVDGIDQGPVGLIGMKLYEISKNFTHTNHMLFNGVSLMSKQVWDSLSAADQELLTQSFEAARKRNLELTVEGEAEKLKEFEQAGGIVTSIKNMDELLSVAEQFQNKYAAEDPKIQSFLDKAKELGAK